MNVLQQIFKKLVRYNSLLCITIKKNLNNVGNTVQRKSSLLIDSCTKDPSSLVIVLIYVFHEYINIKWARWNLRIMYLL